eukprot:TRINITY_DN201_c0_g1_i1.p1 TRINITY_DN201_c0_g1~~TRINITY_DN201_c0_g1_i1.p1  ORF type:complete len:255 (+),score=19.26 TRINITY_DN201_c0_g1_i1:73-837(+)
MSILQYSSSQYYSNMPSLTAAYGRMTRPAYGGASPPTSPRKEGAPAFVTQMARGDGAVNNVMAKVKTPIEKVVRTPVVRRGRVTLVLDLDETLVHSSFEPVACDMQIPLTMDGQSYTAYVAKRPGVDAFLAKAAELFDIVIWTASLRLYAEPLIRQLVRSARCGPIPSLFRDSCTLHKGGYVKDLTSLGTHLDDICILDNSPSVAVFQPQNLIPISSWYDDVTDVSLYELIPHLERMARANRSVREFIQTMTMQ